VKSKRNISDKPGIKKSNSKKEKSQFPIVGIGASAGGLEALEQFFSKMPSDTGMAFVIIQHLDPTHKGIMPELLQRTTSMKVFQASDQLQVKPDHVYVIPPNKSLSLLNGLLHLFEPVGSRGLRLPIDIFFRSLAFERNEKSIGIILSGMGSDGSLGIKAIKEKNGIVVVQDPKSAKFDGMPQSALDTINADIIAPAEVLPERLIKFLKIVPSVHYKSVIDNQSKSEIDKIVILLREHTGHDFSLYKKSTLYRRIERRTGIHQIEKIHDYVRFLQKNPVEIEILFRELLIGVTNFFRDADVWEKLKQDILPGFIKDLPEGHQIRVWVPGCSTGEEAFSWAIILREVLDKDKKHKKLSLKVFATDLDQDAIEKARKGIYPSNIDADVSSERIEKFFTVDAQGYRLNTSIREMVVFATHNIIKDPPFTKLDILSCRNMLIYMEDVLQKKLIGLFNYSLNPGGILLLGTAETIGNETINFKELDPKSKIYKHAMSFQPGELIDVPSSFYGEKVIKPSIKEIQNIGDNLQTLADRIILQTFAPASVLVNERGDILYITGRTGKYLEPVAGKANWNIYAMAREGLRYELPAAFRKAMQSFEQVKVRNVKIGINGGSQLVNITVQRIENPEPIRGMILVVFTDVPEIAKTSGARSNRKASANSVLENELKRSYEDLQSTYEEMQTTQEELKSSNEELQSTNEELQSTNEELTTSKEEMQSLNEELQTVNNELQSKVNDFIQVESDMKNLLNSTEIATLFLDRQLNIRRFTDTVKNIFKIRKADIGRPFTDLVTDLQYPEIEDKVRNVLKTLISTENSVSTHDGRWFNVRIMPYRTLDDHINGLVLTFTDISIAKRLEIELKKANEILRERKTDS
jgi:two-component system, chemotaxis family, CheB/CheR fusion protein